MEIFNCRKCKKLITEWYVKDETKPPFCSGCGNREIESYYPSIWRLCYTLKIITVLRDQLRWRVKYGTW